jgi:nucleoside-diphosphate-sugar epimerase
MKIKTVLISGSHGFLGKHLVGAYLAKGYKVGGIERSTFYDANLLTNAFKTYQPEIIIHAAAYGNLHEQTDAKKIFMANLAGTFNMLESSRDIPYKAFLNISSSSVTLPYETMYSATKAGAERLCSAYVSELGRPICSLRPYSLYGDGEASDRLLPTLVRASVQGGKPITLDPTPVHDWIYVKDFVNAIVACGEHVDKFIGQTVEVGTGIGTSNVDMLRLVEEVTGKPIAYQVSDKKLRSYDTTEWVASVPIANPTPLREGIENYYEWWNKVEGGGI